jgi:hypothetical protein
LIIDLNPHRNFISVVEQKWGMLTLAIAITQESVITPKPERFTIISFVITLELIIESIKPEEHFLRT